jgi:hypothetical protein
MSKQHITRGLFLAAAVWLLATGAAGQFSAWRFEWLALTADVGGILFISVLLPLFLDQPRFHGTPLTGEFYPVSRAWPVWLFWLAIEAFVFHATVAIKALVMAQQIDYHIVRVILLSIWLGLAYCGKIRAWKAAT